MVLVMQRELVGQNLPHLGNPRVNISVLKFERFICAKQFFH